MKEFKSLQDIHTYFSHKSAKYIFKDKVFDSRGITYSQFVKLKYDSINNSLVRDYYTFDGWYIMFWLMTKTNNPYFITTNINLISDSVNIRPAKIKEVLLHLHSNHIISIEHNEEDIKGSTTLNIAIIYNTNYSEEEQGYISLPLEFIRIILPDLKPNEWAIYCYVLVRYSYFTVSNEEDDSGNIIYKYMRTHYAFPTYDQIADKLRMSKETISQAFNALIDSKYKLLDKVTSDKVFTTLDNGKSSYASGGNNRYKIPIMEHIEYVYHNIYKPITDKKRQEYADIKQIGFENIARSPQQRILTGKKYLYILEYYEDLMLKYEKCLQTKDVEGYNYLKDERITF
jgi:DNA-directed RNA polymerase specialized sigma subunit